MESKLGEVIDDHHQLEHHLSLPVFRTVLEVVLVPALPSADVEHYCKRLEITSRLHVGGVISIVSYYNPGISARNIADGVMQGRHS